MPEEVLFEIPDMRVTTQRVVFSDVTFETSYVASTKVSEREPGWILCLFFVVVLMVVFLPLPLPQLWNMHGGIVAFVVVALATIVIRWLPKEHVLTITMTDKMFCEVITRTSQEAEIIQGYTNEAMVRYKETRPT